MRNVEKDSNIKKTKKEKLKRMTSTVTLTLLTGLSIVPFIGYATEIPLGVLNEEMVEDVNNITTEQEGVETEVEESELELSDDGGMELEGSETENTPIEVGKGDLEDEEVVNEEQTTPTGELRSFMGYSLRTASTIPQPTIREARSGIDNRLTNNTVDIVVAGTDGKEVKDIEMVTSPQLGRNYALNGIGERKLIHYETGYTLSDHEYLKGKEIVVSFTARTDEGTTVLNSLIYGGKSYPIEAKVGEDSKRFMYVIPKEEVRELDDYTNVTIKRGEKVPVYIKDMKVELGDTATPVTLPPEEVKLEETANLFDKDEWLSTTPTDKPKSSGVPYVELDLEPNTKYTLSTDMPRKDGTSGYYDVFFFTPDDVASSARNGVTVNEPRTITTDSSGKVRIAMREYDDELKSGTKYINLNKGSYAIPEGSKIKTYSVTANGTYEFKVTYEDGTEEITKTEVNNYVLVRGIPYGWTDANVRLTMDASGGENPITRRIKLPNNQWVTGDKASYNVTDNGKYTFTAEDIDGNQVVETVNITSIDKIKPTISTEQDTDKWTNDAVNIRVTAYDGESGVDKVEMTGRPSNDKGGWDNLFLNSNFAFGLNNWTSELTGGLEVVENNTLMAYGEERFFYSIIALPVGEVYTVSFDARKDGEPDVVYPHQSGNFDESNGAIVTNEWQRHSVTLRIANKHTISFSMGDTESKHYFRNMKLEKGDEATPWIPATADGMGQGSMVYPVVTNGEYTFTATDYAGNTAESKRTISNIDSTPPELNIASDTTGYTRGDKVTLTLTVTDKQSGVHSITLPNGEEVLGKTNLTYTVNDNGEYAFTVEDKVGNRKTYTQKVSNFDRTEPTIEVIGNPTEWDERDEIPLTITALDSQSGVREITLPDGTKVNGSKAMYSVKENGKYVFTVTDNMGNTATQTVDVEYMMIPYKFYLFDAQGRPLKGARFDLLRDGVVYASADSDGNGLVDFGKVPETGTYRMRQTKAPDGHILDPNEKEVEVGDTTDPEEFVSYPRGEVLPATGTHSGLINIVIIAMITVLVIGITVGKRVKIKK